MKRLLTIHESDIYPEKDNINNQDFRERSAARAVVLNKKTNSTYKSKHIQLP